MFCNIRPFRSWRNIITTSLVGILLTGCIDNKQTKPHVHVESIKVFKHTGAIQCEGKGLSLKEMGDELEQAGIDIHCAQSGHDGMMRPTMCGAGTSDIHIYQIPAHKLPHAKQLGFKSVDELKAYQDESCAKH